MDTVKVDIQKLQLLNDRIAQTIDALTQVRLSVHGIQHTSQVSPFAQSPYATSPFAQSPYSMSPYVQPTFATPYGVPFVQPLPFGSGLQHTTAPQVYGTSPWAASSIGWTSQVPWSNGIAHSSYDPMWQIRASQMFPFMQSPIGLY